VILKAEEPSLRWYQFVDALFALCAQLDVVKVVTLGSMYDNVLHSDRIVSGIASTEELISRLEEHRVHLIDYQGPSAIHSVLQSEGLKRGFECISLWCHCPYYLQGTTHFGALSHLGSLLSSLLGFELDVEELEANWRRLSEQIKLLVEENPELQAMIDKLRKAKVRGSWDSLKQSLKKDEKVINLQDFMDK
jgi:predicted ATP-grasp superfamily ATP-dependent carboligase